MRNVIERHGIPFIAKKRMTSFFGLRVINSKLGHNVAINNILPGMHHTAATGERYLKLAEENGTTYDEEIFEFAKKWRIPARKFGTSQDFGDFVAMFCSEQATYIIGQSLVIDGGIDNTTF